MKFRPHFILVLILGLCSLAAGIPQRPAGSYVYDEDRLMTNEQVDFFNRLSEELYRKAGVAMAVAIVDDIGLADARSYAVNVAEKWGVGGKTDEGILIFVALKQRRRSVEVGYGAEGYLPDALVERLQQQTLIPAFRREKYGDGVLALAYGLAQVVATEKRISLETDGALPPQEAPMTVRAWLFVFFVFAAIFVLIGKNRDRKAAFLLGMLLGSGRGGRGFGGGGFGGRGGRGFGGGFGGGHFGGGGSGGGW